jgi:hypothetical protein
MLTSPHRIEETLVAWFIAVMVALHLLKGVVTEIIELVRRLKK